MEHEGVWLVTFFWHCKKAEFWWIPPQLEVMSLKSGISRFFKIVIIIWINSRKIHISRDCAAEKKTWISYLLQYCHSGFLVSKINDIADFCMMAVSHLKIILRVTFILVNRGENDARWVEPLFLKLLRLSAKTRGDFSFAQVGLHVWTLFLPYNYQP